MYSSSPGFVSRTAPVKTKEQKKVSRLAKRSTSAVRENRKPGPVTITILK